MEENIKIEVTDKDVYKHYFSSILIYGIVFFALAICPVLNEQIEYDFCNYIVVLGVYYLAYVALALPIFLYFRPKSILQSRSVAILDYVKRQFKFGLSVDERIKNIEPLENEKQALVILFVKAFFGYTCVNLLCNKYILSMGYNIDFLKEFFSQAVQYGTSNGSSFGIAQYIDDTFDMWRQLIVMVITFVLGFSYLTELDLFKNKIKTVDTTPLGIITCISCYYPFLILTDKLIPRFPEQAIPVDNFTLRIILNVLVVLAHLGMMLAVLRLGTKAGNLTNRGIVTSFPYNIVRHPEYSMNMIYIILITIPVMLLGEISMFGKIIIACGIGLWIYLYYLRAVTEERNLLQDSEYQEYVKKVTKRFIPKVF